MTTPIRKKLIEVSIPLEAINTASAREKSIRHGHPSTMHLWWARRPLAACRAVLFAQLVDDPSAWPDRFPTTEDQEAERRRLHRVIERIVPWDASVDVAALDEARWYIARSVAWGFGEEPPPKDDGRAILAFLQSKAPPVYDPFSGGGSIPLEAQRLGLRSYGSDINPVAVLIGKALIEIPPKFAGRPPVNASAQRELGGRWSGRGAQGLADDIRHYGLWMREAAQKTIGHLYPKATLADGGAATVVAWIWARTVRSPDPAAKGAIVPLASSFLLSTKGSEKSWVEPVIDPTAKDGWRFEVHTGLLSKSDEERLKRGTKTGRGTNFQCVLTGALIDPDFVRNEGRAGRIGERLMAIVAEGHPSRVYLSPTLEHEEVAASAKPGDTTAIDVEMPDNPRWFSPPGYGLTRYVDIFTRRQLAALTTFSDLIPEGRAKALSDAIAAGMPDDQVRLNDGGEGATAYADAVATYLAFAVSKSSTRSCSLALWEAGMGRLAGAMGRQALPMQWSFAETNPIAGAGGDIAGTAVSVAENLQNLGMAGPGFLKNQVAQKNSFHGQAVVISTDPPYYDNIGYADLSDFFYVWLRRSLSDTWPQLFRRLTTPKREELVAIPQRHGGRDGAEAFFMAGMSEALVAMKKAATDAEPLTIYYAFKQSEVGTDGVTSAGWASFLQAVVDAGLLVDGTWPLRTEATNSLKANINALASSIVLVCRKRSLDAAILTRADFIRVLKAELPAAIDAIRKAGVGPVDMQQSVIGPGMGIFSRHSKILEDDDGAMSVKTALALINRVWEEIENELDAAFDAETQVALAWYATYGFDLRPSGELITLANAKNTPSNVLFASGVFADMRGKACLAAREDLPRDWTPSRDKTLTVWECVQHTARVLNAPDGGGEAAASLVGQMGAKANEARALAYRLFEIATQKGWSAEALVYNELASEWAKLEDLAAANPTGASAGETKQAAFEF